MSQIQNNLRKDLSWDQGAIVRGPRHKKQISLVFTGGHFAEGFEHILGVLADEDIRGSFFFTGDFLNIKAYEPMVKRAIVEGHYVGPHSYAHLLYCPWEDRNQTLIDQAAFNNDLDKNIDQLVVMGMPRDTIKYWIPPYEYYNQQIADWSDAYGLQLINITHGTLSHTDYTGENDKNFRSSDTIYNSIMTYADTKENGLNGFMLLVHVGAGDGRSDKFFPRLKSLINDLRARGYTFISLAELLED
ncbi:polysaccharide deacetylase family protein [Poriferisphaera sp. WC338]|uniref:polysaccharide deacetylase family protein n=1 Tax=Poriferisphaera sp. WC338 TaxID=3425129 RepID=UPI003D819E0C